MINSNLHLDRHYAPGDIEAIVTAALTGRGQEEEDLAPEDLAKLDQFHTGGLEATRQLAQLANIRPEDRILDIGGGIGGPARLLAREFGCRVTVLDITEAYCRLGEKLTERTKLRDRVSFMHGSALDIPFGENTFEVVWTQHSLMNIAEKERLYTQLARVLRRGGRLAVHEVVAGPLQPIYLPALWARDASLNFLVSPQALRDGLSEAGLRECSWEDTSEWSLAWLEARLAEQEKAGTGSAGLGLQLLLGPDFTAMAQNHLRNLREGRVRIVQGLFERL